MGKLEELLKRIEDGDTDAVSELKQAMAEEKSATEAKAARAERDLKLAKDDGLRKRYPRAIRAYEKGRLKLPDDFSEEALKTALQDKEDELAEMGAPVEPSSASPAPAPEVKEGAGFGAPQGAQAPGGTPRNLVAEYLDALKGSTVHDHAKANSVLIELNKAGMKDEIEQITGMLSARPIIDNGL